MNLNTARIVHIRSKDGNSTLLVDAKHQTRLALQKVGIDIDAHLRGGGTVAECPARALLQYADVAPIRLLKFEIDTAV